VDATIRYHFEAHKDIKRLIWEWQMFQYNLKVEIENNIIMISYIINIEKYDHNPSFSVSTNLNVSLSFAIVNRGVGHKDKYTTNPFHPN
jgi:hypothetical protein